MTSTKKEFSVWIVKYAMTRGIVQDTMHFLNSDRDADRGYVANQNQPGFYKIGRDAFLTKREAVNEANRLKDLKINSLERQLAKAMTTTF